jgi:membrane protein implicated in regulation of membrane protease activity
MSYFPILIFAALGGVVVVLMLGLVNLARGGDPARSNRLMRWRIALQGLAILLILVAVLMAHKS